jgi:hypothetical protein
MRIIDLHCYPGTKEWIASQGPYVEALAKYWKRDWSGKEESEVLKEFADAGVDACLVALDLETTIGTQPVGNDYVHAMWKRHPSASSSALGPISRRKPEARWRSSFLASISIRSCSTSRWTTGATTRRSS